MPLPRGCIVKNDPHHHFLRWKAARALKCSRADHERSFPIDAALLSRRNRRLICLVRIKILAEGWLYLWDGRYLHALRWRVSMKVISIYSSFSLVNREMLSLLRRAASMIRPSLWERSSIGSLMQATLEAYQELAVSQVNRCVSISRFLEESSHH